MSPKVFRSGDRVTTPLGRGAVNYLRMKGPDYTEAQVYSIVLDDKLKESREPPYPFYNGTIIQPSDVSEEPVDVTVEDDHISISDGAGEIVYWDRQEWVDDDSIVVAMAHAIYIGVFYGSVSLRRLLNMNHTGDS